MKFAEPFAPWQGTFWHGILPAHILQPVYDKDGTLDNAEWNRNPTVGCGPYVFKEWESGSFARFVASDNYWLGRPKIDELFIRFVPDDASQVAALKAGDGDLGTFISYSDIPTLQESGVKMVTVFSGYNEGLYFYVDPEKGHPALQDANVRKAIALAFDRAVAVRGPAAWPGQARRDRLGCHALERSVDRGHIRTIPSRPRRCWTRPAGSTATATACATRTASSSRSTMAPPPARSARTPRPCSSRQCRRSASRSTCSTTIPTSSSAAMGRVDRRQGRTRYL